MGFAGMTAIPASRETRAPQLNVMIAAAAVLSLALWPVEIHRAFGLPAHPLIIHVPVVFIPILGIAVIATAFWPQRLERYTPVLAAFAVIANAATLLAVGAGEAFREDRNQPGFASPTLDQHAEAGEFLRWLMIILTALLVAALFTRARRIVLVVAAITAAAAVFWVIRTGHLGAKLAWSEPGPGGPPPGFQQPRP
jgi:uncharacterized membrane protein